MADIPVALGMAEMIVDVFQMVEIAVAEHHTDFFFQHVLRLFEEKCAVSDPRHRIPLGFPAQHLLALFRLGHFADDMRIRLLVLPGNGPRTDFVKAVLRILCLPVPFHWGQRLRITAPLFCRLLQTHLVDLFILQILTCALPVAVQNLRSVHIRYNNFLFTSADQIQQKCIVAFRHVGVVFLHLCFQPQRIFPLTELRRHRVERI